MGDIFHGNVNFESLVREVVSKGGAFEPNALSVGAIEAILSELETLDFLRYLRGTEWSVQEHYEVVRARHHERTDMPVITRVGDELGWRVRLPHVRGARNGLWYPNYVNVLRYYADHEDRISVHRDFSYDHYFIGILTVEGYAEFALHGKEPIDKPTIWQLGPGTLVLLRASDLYDGAIRPYHEPYSPKYGRRTALVYRMDIRLLAEVEQQLAVSGGAYDD